MKTKKIAAKKKIFLCTITMMIGYIGQAQIDTNFQTYSMDAVIANGNELPYAGVGTYLDQQNKTHIAWIKSNGNQNLLMYTLFDPADTSATTTKQIQTGVDTNRKVAPYIVTDQNNNPHIAYLIKRDPNQGINTGNYAVMYAGDSDGDGSFEVSQVSTNANDPNNDDDDTYNCYVNGRPNVVLDGTDVVVTYISTQQNVYGDKYYIFANKTPSSWNHSQEMNIDDLVGNTSVSDGIAMPAKMQAPFTLGVIDISNYAPWIIYPNGGSWQKTEITGYAATFANDHAQLTIDNGGTLHYLWFYDDSSSFCHTTINNGNYTTVQETETENRTTGNLYPATVDRTTGERVYFYEESFGEAYFIVFNNGQPQEYEVKGIGEPFGREALHVNNGHVSMVTHSENDEKLFITTNKSFSTGIEYSDLGESINIFPNPSTGQINIQKDNTQGEQILIKVNNMMGQVILTETRDINDKASINIPGNAGIYFVEITAESGASFTEKIIKMD